MEKVRSLIPLDEWNSQAINNLVEKPPFVAGVPSTGISCINVDVTTGGLCGAHLWDIARLRRCRDGYTNVRCDVCETIFERRVISGE